MRVEFPLFAAQVALFAWVLHQGTMGGVWRSQLTGETSRPIAHHKVVHDPSGHLPLRGMATFDGSDSDACLRLEGFLITAVVALQNAGVMPPLQSHQVPARLQGTSCGIDEPDLAALLAEFDAAWREAGLNAVGPLGQP